MVVLRLYIYFCDTVGPFYTIPFGGFITDYGDLSCVCNIQNFRLGWLEYFIRKRGGWSEWIIVKFMISSDSQLNWPASLQWGQNHPIPSWQACRSRLFCLKLETYWVVNHLALGANFFRVPSAFCRQSDWCLIQYNKPHKSSGWKVIQKCYPSLKKG